MALTDKLAQVVQKASIGPCRAATTGPVSLSGSQAVDGVRLGGGDRCLVKDQDDLSQNGIYVAQQGQWQRAADMRGDIVPGATVSIWGGEENKGALFQINFSGKARVGATEFRMVRMDRLEQVNKFEIEVVHKLMQEEMGGVLRQMARLEQMVSALRGELAALKAEKAEAAKTAIMDSLTAMETAQERLDAGRGGGAPEPVQAVLEEAGLSFSDTYERVNERLVAMYRDAMQGSELARNYGGTFDNRSTSDWLRHAERLDSAIEWNRGRKVETIS